MITLEHLDIIKNIETYWLDSLEVESIEVKKVQSKYDKSLYLEVEYPTINLSINITNPRITGKDWDEFKLNFLIELLKNELESKSKEGFISKLTSLLKFHLKLAVVNYMKNAKQDIQNLMDRLEKTFQLAKII